MEIGFLFRTMIESLKTETDRTRALFELEPLGVMGYEKALAFVFDQSDFRLDEVKTKLSRSYKDLYKTCKQSKVFCTGILFSELFRQLGLRTDKMICGRQSERLFYLNFWHSLSPTYIGSITPDQSNAVNIQVGFQSDYRGIDTDRHISHFLARLIWKESF